MGGPREATTLGEDTAAARQEVRRLSNQAIICLGLAAPAFSEPVFGRDALPLRCNAKPIILSSGCRVRNIAVDIASRTEQGGKAHPLNTSLVRRSGKIIPFLMRIQHRYRNALFGQTLFEVLLFSLAQLGFEQALIPVNILLMSM